MAERTSYAEGVPSWVDLMTSDPEGARAFYGGLFGWEFRIDPDPQTGNYTMALVRGKLVAGLGGQPAPDGAPTAWTTYFAVDDVDKTVEQIRGHGGTVLMEPMQVPDAGRMAVAADPGGAAFGLWQAGQHTGAELVNEPSTLNWNELSTRDLEGATRFYTAILGVSWEDYETSEQGPRYRVFSAGGNVAGGAMQMSEQFPAEVPAHWLTYFSVADIDAVVALATELGGSVQVPRSDTAQGPIAVLIDPQGGRFAVIELAGTGD